MIWNEDREVDFADHPVRGSPEYNSVVLGFIRLREAFQFAHAWRQFIIGSEDLECQDKFAEIRHRILNDPCRHELPVKVLDRCLEITYLNSLNPIEALKNCYLEEESSKSYLMAAKDLCSEAIQGVLSGMKWVADKHNNSPDLLKSLWDLEMRESLLLKERIEKFLVLLEKS